MKAITTLSCLAALACGAFAADVFESFDQPTYRHQTRADLYDSVGNRVSGVIVRDGRIIWADGKPVSMTAAVYGGRIYYTIRVQSLPAGRNYKAGYWQQDSTGQVAFTNWAYVPSVYSSIWLNSIHLY